MLVDDHEFQERLQGMICKLTRDYHLAKDLLQMALRQVWLIESKGRKYTQAWYVKMCEHRLLDHLGEGGSVDAPKRRHLACPLSDLEGSEASVPDQVIVEDSVLPLVAAADLVRELSRRLDPLKAEVLLDLVEGYGIAEVAGRLHISERTVFNYRKVIIATALQIGLAE